MAARKSPAGGRKASASALVEQQLEKYRSMRDFSVTAEPSGGNSKAAAGLPYVVQKHAATRLHYDFRLGWDGVMKSWAVTKGPSYVTADKRLAMQTEDHPVEYSGFEGTIPKGQYGGGTVMVWDTGTWEPQPEHDFDEGLKTGSLKFVLHGKKLKGKWALIRMKPRNAREAEKPAWLLIKEHDEYERSADSEPVTEAAPDSALTGRSLEQIGGAADHVWQSNRPETAAPASRRKTAENDMRERLRAKFNKSATPATRTASREAKSRSAKKNSDTAASSKKSDPEPAARRKFLAPQLAVQADKPPRGTDWRYELKLDGYRIQAHVENGTATLYTRSGLDWTHRMAAVASALESLPLKSAVLDGEVTVLDAQGQTSFALLQAAFQEKQKAEMTYFLFDLLELDGKDMREMPLTKRKATLAEVLSHAPKGIRYNEHLEGDGEELFRAACRHHAEGLVCKRADSKYAPGRHPSWVKVKCVLVQEFVIGGWTPPAKGARGIGALLLGYYDGDQLLYAGRTGTGFTFQSAEDLKSRLSRIPRERSPFADLPRGAAKDARFVSPKLVCEVSFATWTADHLVRQASFQGMREDKAATEVRREMSAPVGRVEIAAEREARAGKASPAQTQAATNIRLTHPDKILDPETGLTKQQMFDYVVAASEHLFREVAGRPLTLVRCPDGVTGQTFYQKHIAKGMPAGVKPVPVRDKSGNTEDYLEADTIEALAGLAQFGVLEFHPWGSYSKTLETPDRMIFDLDPDEALPWSALSTAAQDVRSRLKAIGLASFVKSTGGKGLHVVAPVQPRLEWPEFKQLAHALVEEMQRENPKLYLTKMSKAARKGKIYLDYLRNERGATAVAAWSCRARKGIPIAMPLAWDELAEWKSAPRFRVVDFARWRGRLENDPWNDLYSLKQSLDA